MLLLIARRKRPTVAGIQKATRRGVQSGTKSCLDERASSRPGIDCALYQSYNIQAVLFGLETFAAIALPGILFVAAFSIACPAILWVPLYQFLFIGYWFWGNLLGPGFGIPTLSTTILTPLGGYMSVGFFGAEGPFNRTGTEGPFNHTTALQGTESLLLLLNISILVMVVLSKYLTWEQTRR